MKTLTKWMLAAFAATAIVGCDPFEKAVSGPPAVASAGFSSDGTAFNGTVSGTAWTIPGVPGICGNTTAGLAEVPGFIFVKFNKLLDGYSIQTTPTDCTPVAALNLAVTPAPPAGAAWYACYNPQAPSPDEGASVMIFLDSAALPPAGWLTALPIPSGGNAVTPVHATGTVHDKDGAAASFDVTVQIDPDPGVSGTPTFTGTTATSTTVNWTAAECAVAGTTTYLVERAPNVPTGTPPVNAPGTFAGLCGGASQPACSTALTFGDTGLTTATIYWYRVTAMSSGGVSGVPTTAASVTTL